MKFTELHLHSYLCSGGKCSLISKTSLSQVVMNTAFQSIQIYQKGRSCRVLQEFLGQGLDCRLSSCPLWVKAEQLSLFRNSDSFGCSMMYHSLSLSHVGSDMWGAGWEHSQRQTPAATDPNSARTNFLRHGDLVVPLDPEFSPLEIYFLNPAVFLSLYLP